MSDEKATPISAGASTRVDFNLKDAINSNGNNGEEGEQGGGELNAEEQERLLEEKEYEGLSPEEITAKKAEKANATKNELPQLSEEQEKLVLKKLLGDDFDGDVESARNKLKKQPVEPTPEEKLVAENALEQRMLAVHINSGGTVESFAALKNIATTDKVADLSMAMIRKELKEFDPELTESEVEEIISESHYRYKLDELEKDEDETEDEFEKRKATLKRKIDLGIKRIEANGKNIQEKAKATLANLRLSIEGSDLQLRDKEQTEKTISSKTDEYLKSIPKKVTLELGKGLDGTTDLQPIQYDVADSDIEEVRKLLKDPAQRNNLLQTEDGTVNVEAIAEILLENRNLKRAARVGYFQGSSDQVTHFKKVFPYMNAGDLGVGGGGKPIDKNGIKRQPASSGATSRL